MFMFVLLTGELFKLGMLHESIMHQCIKEVCVCACVCVCVCMCVRVWPINVNIKFQKRLQLYKNNSNT